MKSNKLTVISHHWYCHIYVTLITQHGRLKMVPSADWKLSSVDIMLDHVVIERSQKIEHDFFTLKCSLKIKTRRQF